MANDVKIVISAVDNASKVLSGVQGQLKATGAAGVGLGDKFGAVAGKIAMVTGAVGAVTGVLVGAGVAVKKYADEFLNYAMQVGNLSRRIGASAEETSILIQVADDAAVSYEALSAAMLGAVRKGVDPSIDSLMQLSDAYLRLQPGLERTRFLLENFGRGGAEMARLMELGSDKIKEMGEAVKGTSLVLDEKAIENAEEYRKAIDAATDAWQQMKLTVGGEVAPVLTDVINEATRELEKYALELKIVEDMINRELDPSTGFALLTLATYDAKAAQFAYNTIIDEGAKKLTAMAESGMGDLRRLENVTYEVGAALEEMGMGDLKAVDMPVTIGIDENKIREAAEAVSAAFWDVNPSITSAIQDAIDKVAWMEAGGAGVEQLFDAVMLNAPKLGDQLGNALQQVLIQSLATSVKAGMESAYAAAIKLRDESRALGLDMNYDQARAIIDEAVSQPVDKPINFTDAQGNPIDINNLLGEAGEIAPTNVPVNLVNAEGEPIDPTTMFVFEEPVNLPVSPVDIMGMPFGTLALQRTIAQPLEIPVMLTDGEGGEFNLANVLEIPDTDDQEKAFSALAAVLLEELAPAADEAQKQLRMLTMFMGAAAASARALATAANSAAKAIAALKSRTIVLTTIIRTVYETVGSPPASGAIGGVAEGMTPEERGQLAMGGPVEAGGMYLVGERGPELIVPRESGTVIPNHKLGMGGGSYVVGQINIYTQPGQSPAAVANAVIAEMNRRMASARRSGLAYVG